MRRVLSTGRLFAGNEPKYERVLRERRYLLRELPPGLSRTNEHAQITDNYITGTRLRLRKSRWVATNEWTLKLTQKHAPQPPDFSRTLITSIYLNEYEYEVFSIYEGNEIRKNRYPYEHEGRKFSVNVFLGELHGLVLAEVEFASDEEMAKFAVPAFAVADVSNDERFTGGQLAISSAKELRRMLEEFRLM